MPENAIPNFTVSEIENGTLLIIDDASKDHITEVRIVEIPRNLERV